MKRRKKYVRSNAKRTLRLQRKPNKTPSGSGGWPIRLPSRKLALRRVRSTSLKCTHACEVASGLTCGSAVTTATALQKRLRRTLRGYGRR